MAAFEINVTNPTTVDRFALRFSFAPPSEAGFPFSRLFSKTLRERELPTITIELPARGLRPVAVPLPAPIRGRLPARRITIETRYPFGLWRAWAYFTPALTAMVYPAPEFDAPPMPFTGAGVGETAGMASSGDDFAGVRPYQPGDAQKMIAWKLAARSDELSVKQFEAAGGGELMLDYRGAARSSWHRGTAVALDTLGARCRCFAHAVRTEASRRDDFHRQRCGASRALPDGSCRLHRLEARMSAVAQPAPTLRAKLARFFAPFTLLFAPQVSSAARERRDMLVLLLAVTFVVIPHFEHLVWWATAVLVLLLIWRAFLTVTQRPIPSRLLMFPLLIAASAAVYLQYRTLVGQQAGVTFLLLLMALKLLEMRARRDIFVVIFLSFFILLTQFLNGQEIHVAAMALLR